LDQKGIVRIEIGERETVVKDIRRPGYQGIRKTRRV